MCHTRTCPLCQGRRFVAKDVGLCCDTASFPQRWPWAMRCYPSSYETPCRGSSGTVTGAGGRMALAGYVVDAVVLEGRGSGRSPRSPGCPRPGSRFSSPATARGGYEALVPRSRRSLRRLVDHRPHRVRGCRTPKECHSTRGTRHGGRPGGRTVQLVPARQTPPPNPGRFSICRKKLSRHQRRRCVDGLELSCICALC